MFLILIHRFQKCFSKIYIIICTNKVKNQQKFTCFEEKKTFVHAQHAKIRITFAIYSDGNIVTWFQLICGKVDVCLEYMKSHYYLPNPDLSIILQSFPFDSQILMSRDRTQSHRLVGNSRRSKWLQAPLRRWREM
jgi:hypothetical protein